MNIEHLCYSNFIYSCPSLVALQLFHSTLQQITHHNQCIMYVLLRFFNFTAYKIEMDLCRHVLYCPYCSWFAAQSGYCSSWFAFLCNSTTFHVSTFILTKSMLFPSNDYFIHDQMRWREKKSKSDKTIERHSLEE